MSWALLAPGALIAAVSCNSIWGIDALTYGAAGSGGGTTAGTPTAGTGATSGSGGSAGAGGAGNGGEGGSGGEGPHAPTVTWCAGFGDAVSQVSAGVATGDTGDIVLAGNHDGQPNFGGGPPPTAGVDDVFLVRLDSSGAHQWSRFMGDSRGQTAADVALDPAGLEVALIGDFQGTMDVGGVVLTGPTSPNTTDIYVAKLSTSGATVWAKGLGGTDGVPRRSGGVGLDGEGNVLLSGSFEGSVDVVGTNVSSQGDDDLLVAKLASATGAHTWHARYGATGEERGLGLGLDAVGAPVAVGTVHSGTMSCAGHSVTTINFVDALAVDLNAAGTDHWCAGWGEVATNGCDGTDADCTQKAKDVAVDAQGNVAVTGSFTGSIDFGALAGSHVSAGGQDAFVALVDVSGAPLWSHAYGAAGSQNGSSVAFDSQGNVVLAGTFSGTVDFGAGPVTSAGDQDVFLLALDPSGALLWSLTFGGPSTESGVRVAVGPGDRVVLFGTFVGTIDLGGDCSLTSAGLTDVFVAAFDP